MLFDQPDSFGPALKKLTDALNSDLDWIREHTRLGAMAERWQLRDRPDDLLLRGEELICPFHDWRFDGMGLCTGVPSGQRIPTRIAKGLRIVASWHVRERDGSIQIGAVRAVESTQSSD